MIRVFLEVAPKRSFAMAVDWPGWGRSGKTPELALEALEGYRERYRPVTRIASITLPDDRMEVIEELTGNATTEFGAPGAIPEVDRAFDADLARLVSLMEAVWRQFDSVAADAPESLRKGPRGGGRDTSKIVEHVHGAEAGYAGAIGLKTRAMDPVEVRHAVVDRLRELGRAHEQTKWPAPTFIRRTAWHALDHAWEIEDRSE